MLVYSLTFVSSSISFSPYINFKVPIALDTLLTLYFTSSISSNMKSIFDPRYVKFGVNKIYPPSSSAILSVSRALLYTLLKSIYVVFFLIISLPLSTTFPTSFSSYFCCLHSLILLVDGMNIILVLDFLFPWLMYIVKSYFAIIL